MADRIPDFSNKVRNSIAEELRGRLVCLKVDGVTKSTRHIIGINVQYIKDAKIDVHTLSVREMFSRHTALNIKSEILSTLDSFELSVRNLLTSTTDTGSNMIISFPECDLDPSDATLQTVKCAAHTLQLAVHDAIKNSEETAAILKKALGTACALRKLNRVKELRKQGHAMPVLDVTTRWDSSFDMLESVLAVKEYAVAHESEDDLLCLTDEEWQLVEDVIEALRPAREATIILQDSQLLLGDFYANWMKCKLNTKKIKSNLAKLIVENMESREKGRVNKKGQETLPPLFDHPGFKAAILLDPRFKSILSKEDIEEAKKFLKVVWKKLQALKEEEEEAALLANRNPQVNKAGEGSDDEEDDEFAAFIKAKNNEHDESETSWETKIENLVNTYVRTTSSLPLKADVLQFWETQRMIQPELYLLATTVLAIPSAQVSVERLFSSLGFILNPLRFNLGSQRIDDILVLHGNDDVTKRTPVVETKMEVERSSSATSSSFLSSSSGN